MKNRLQIILLILSLFFLALNNSIAAEDFIFKSKSIELSENGNLIIAKDGVEINSSDGLKIFSDESRYSKIPNKLQLIGNVIIIDNQKNITLKSNKVEYNKNLEEIISKNQTFFNIDNKYNIETSNIKYSRIIDKVESFEKTTLLDNFTNKIETNSFIYLIKKKEFKSKNLILTDKYLNKYFSNEAAISLAKNEIAAKDIEVYFSENGDFGKHARLKGNSMISSNDISIIKKGIFTTCKENDSCPPWSLQSEQITHDKNKKTINYKNAWLRIYDKPVFYFPKFFHPDPTVERQSGFLIPSIASSTVNGNSLKIPYFKVLADNKDFTITPRFFFNNDILIQNEYRQIEKNSNHISDFSIKKQDSSTKSHFFSNTKFFFEETFFESSDVEINLEKTTNDTYLKSDYIESDINNNQSLLNSYVKYEANRQDLNFFGEISAYEDLTQEKNSDKFQYVLPSFNLSKLIKTNKDLKGDINYTASGSNQKRNTNINESYFNNNLEYNSNLLILKNGLVNSFNLMFKNVSKKGKNSDSYSNDFENDNFFSSLLTSSLPMKNEHDNFISNLSPKASLRFSPHKSENLSTLDRQINMTNLFSKNRLGLSDSLEGGQSLTLGIDYDLIKKNNYTVFSSSLGQVFRDIKDDKLPLSSTMQDKRSDIIGRLEISPSENFKLNYNFSADNNFDTLNYNFVEANIKVNNFITSFEFLEENNLVGSDSYFSNNINYKFNKNNSLAYSTRRNRKTDLTEFYKLMYEYKNDCLVAAIEFNKDYYEDRDIKPNEEIFFRLTLTPFTSINSPNFKK